MQSLAPLKVMHIISGDLWAGAEVQAYTLLRQLHPKTNLLIVLMNQGELAEKLDQLGIPLLVIDERKYSSVQLILRLWSAIRHFKPNIIHTHRQKENILGSLANLLSIPFRGKLTGSIRTVHGAAEFNPTGRQKIQAWLDRFVGRYLQKKVISVSADLSQKLIRVFPASHIVVIPNGVDQEMLTQGATLADFKQSMPSKKHVGIIGRLEAVKRVDIFLQMAAVLLAQEPDRWQFHVIGDGKLTSALKDQTRDLGITPNLIFHGHRKDISTCIVSLDAIIMCSDHEGTPMIALEAMALGTMMIVHAVGGLKEIFADLPELLVTHNSPEEYAQRLISGMKNPRRAYLFPPQFSAASNARSVLELYEQTMTL